MNILAEVKSLNFSANGYIVVGSGIMVMHGLKEPHDIDLVVSPEVFNNAQKEGWGQVPYTYQDKLGKFYLRKMDIELYLDVNHGESFRPTLEELLSRAEYFDGVPFLSFEDLIKFKKSYDRPKDRVDIKLIEEYLNNFDVQKIHI